MRKKDYETLIPVLQRARELIDNGFFMSEYQVLLWIESALADALQEDNSRFNHELWFKALREDCYA